jgi:SAM-dependent methyltransferase
MHVLGSAGPASRALDLGSGSGRDALHLLERGFEVLAVDSHPAALEALRERATAAGLGERLSCKALRFEDLALEPESYDLINASMALPFCEPERHKELWERIRAALKPRGVFSGHFFGKHDGLAHDRPDMTFLWQSEVESMLIGLEIVEFSEHELDRETAQGEMRHWHYFDVVVRKC